MTVIAPFDGKARTSRPRSAAPQRGEAIATSTSRKPAPDRGTAVPKTCRGDGRRTLLLSPRCPVASKIPAPTKVCTSPSLPVGGAKIVGMAEETALRQALDDAMDEVRPRPGMLAHPRRQSEELTGMASLGRGRAVEKDEDHYAPRGVQPRKWSFTTLAEARRHFKQRVHAMERSNDFMLALQDKLGELMHDLKDHSVSSSTSCGSSESMSPYASRLDYIQRSVDELITRLPSS
mmetsp:Transcript_47018/g.87916  ORF Transcript_47018/g.87916 Transcript_47018/m.87916 type:complete len:234 (-) Transcript_47018:144-845(-)